jgi:AAA15 family ATPase/GTPase
LEHFIKNIEITNFKSIRHAEVKDCRRVNVFVGYPNVGKSNILEALSLDSVSEEEKLKDLIRVTTDPTIFFNGGIKNTIAIEFDNIFRIEAKFENENFVVRYGIKKHNIDLINYNRTPHYTLPYKQTCYFKDFLFEKRGDELILKDSLRNTKLKKYEFKKKAQSKLGDFSTLSYPFGENLFSVIQSNSEIRKDLGGLLKLYNLKMLFDSSYQSFSLLKTIDEENVFSVDYSLIAETLQRLFFYKTAIQSNKEQILLLEEPESHMFPPYISKMTGDIIYDENGNQFFIATHSPYILGDLIRDVEPAELSVYIVDYDAAKGETIIHRMNDEEVNEAYQFGHDFFMNINQFLPNTQHEQV